MQDGKTTDAGTFRSTAGGVFITANQLSHDFERERKELVKKNSLPDWTRHKQRFDILWMLLLEAKEGMTSPPVGFDALSQHLRSAAEIARKLRQPVVRSSGKYLDFSAPLKSTAEAGMNAVKAGADFDGMKDPFTFLGQRNAEPDGNNSTPKRGGAKRKKRKRQPSAVTEAKRKAKQELHEREDTILKEYEKEFTNYADYARTKNVKCVLGWPTLDPGEVERAIGAARRRKRYRERMKARNKNKAELK